MKRRLVTIVLVLIAIGALAGSGFLFGFQTGKKVPEKILIEEVSNIAAQKPDTVDFGIFWQAWKIVNDEYLLDGGISAKDKVYGAIRGLISSLGDPYSEFFSPEDNKKFQEDIQGSFGGIGAELGAKKGRVVIIAPLKDTPASFAGLKPGDEILAINATSTDGMSVGTAVRLIRGPVGTEVTLLILREGLDKPREFKIVRATITVPILESKMIDDIAHVHLQSFNANANDLFAQEVRKALTSGARGIVLDLRNNPGGYLDVAVELAGWFLPRGAIVVSEVGRNNKVFAELRAHGNAALEKFPLVVLVNQGSASASEILAGALRDIRNITVVGETTFGKGTVQQLLPLSDGSSIKITIAHWVFPSGKILEKTGIVPDVEVKLTDKDIEEQKDPQLDKAVDVLQAKFRKQQRE